MYWGLFIGNYHRVDVVAPATMRLRVVVIKIQFSTFRFLFHYPHITPIYYSSFHFIFH